MDLRSMSNSSIYTHIIKTPSIDKGRFYINTAKLHLEDIRNIIKNYNETKCSPISKIYYERTMYEYCSTLKELHETYETRLTEEINQLTNFEKKELNKLFFEAFPENNPIIDVNPQKFLLLFPEAVKYSYITRARKFLVYVLSFLAKYENEDM